MIRTLQIDVPPPQGVTRCVNDCPFCVSKQEGSRMKQDGSVVEIVPMMESEMFSGS